MSIPARLSLHLFPLTDEDSVHDFGQPRLGNFMMSLDMLVNERGE